MANYELGSLIWRIKGDTKDYDKKIDSSEKRTKTMASQAGATAKRIAKMGLAFGAAALSVGKLVSIGRESVQLYGEQVTAENKLAAAIRTTGGDVDELLPKYKDLASSIQQVTVEGDESTLALIQQAKSLGVADDQIEEATKGAIGLSKALGIGTQQAIRGVANAFEGNFTTLQRYIPALRTTEDESEKLAIVQKAMADGFETAKAEADSSFGAIQQYDNALGDLKEQLGATIADGMEPLVGRLTDLVTGWTENIAKTRQFKAALEDLENDGQQAVDAMNIDELSENLQIARERLERLTQANQGLLETKDITEAREYIKALEEERAAKAELARWSGIEESALDELQKKEKEAAEAKAKAAEENSKAAKELIELQYEQLEPQEQKIYDLQQEIDTWAALRNQLRDAGQDYSKIQDLINELVEQRNELTETEVESTAIITQAQRDALDQRIFERQAWELEKDALRAEETQKELEALEERKQKYADVAESYVLNFTSAFEEVGAALVNQEDAWAAVGQAALGTIAEVVRALGQLLAAKAAELYADAFFSAGASLPFAIAATAGSAAAFTAAGAIESSAQNFQEGGFVQPRPGTPNTGDRVPARLNPREVVLTEDDANELLSRIRSGNMGTTRVTVNLGSKTLYDDISRATDNGEIIVNPRSVRR